MTKQILKSLLLSILIAPAAFASDTPSSFNQYGNIDYTSPEDDMDNYIAEKAPMESTNRVYFGVNAGFNLTNLKPDIKSSYSEQQLSFRPFGYTAGLFGGVGTNIRNFYIGAELSGNYNTLNRNASTRYVLISIKEPISIGLDIMPGFLNYQKTFLLYGRLGLGANLFKFKPTSVANPSNTLSGSSNKKIVTSLRAGAGMEFFITESIGIRVEYLMNSYKNITNTYTNSSSGATYIHSYPSTLTNQVDIGMTINF